MLVAHGRVALATARSRGLGAVIARRPCCRSAGPCSGRRGSPTIRRAGLSATRWLPEPGSGPGPAMHEMGAWPADGRDVIAPVPSAAAVPCAVRHAAMPALAVPGTAARPAPACRIAVPGRAGWRDMSSRVSPPFWVMDSVSWTGAGTGPAGPGDHFCGQQTGKSGAGGRAGSFPSQTELSVS
jgi:hypothetical protein